MDKQYGLWTVLGPSETKKYYSKCQCKCGVIKDVNNSALRLGKSVSCGCGLYKPNRPTLNKVLFDKAKSYIGQTINGIKILDVYKGDKFYFFKCQCSCGKIFTARKNAILTGAIKNCTHDVKKNLDIGAKKYKDGCKGGSSVYSTMSRLNGSVNKNSTTRQNGVSICKNGKYRAYIVFKRKQYYLGVYDKIEDAIVARKNAEKNIYGSFLEWYKNTYPNKSNGINTNTPKD